VCEIKQNAPKVETWIQNLLAHASSCTATAGRRQWRADGAPRAALRGGAQRAAQRAAAQVGLVSPGGQIEYMGCQVGGYMDYRILAVID
jgi:hypothetical protein